MAFSCPAVQEDFRYDSDLHYAPPVRIKWMTRAKKLSIERWVFVQCCGQTEKVRSYFDGRIISSLHPCKRRSSYLQTTMRHHSGHLLLRRHTHSQVIKNTPPLAQWSCCGAVIPAWNDAWDSRDKKIPFMFVDSGCKAGRYDEETLTAKGSLDDLEKCFASRFIRDVALVARPINRRTKPSSGKSSGDQTLVLEKGMVIDPRNVKFTQNTVERSFSDGRLLLDVMLQIFQGKMKIEDIPEIRVAARNNLHDEGKFYSADNRRLLMFKLLRLDEIHVTRIKWTDEFDNKLRQNVPFDSLTRVKLDKQGINSLRKELTKEIFRKNEDESTGAEIPFFIPNACAGYVIGSSGNTIIGLREKFSCDITLQDLRRLHPKHPLPEFIDIVAITVKVRDSKRRSRPHAARKEILKMVTKLMKRDEDTQRQCKGPRKRSGPELIHLNEKKLRVQSLTPKLIGIGVHGPVFATFDQTGTQCIGPIRVKRTNPEIV